MAFIAFMVSINLVISYKLFPRLPPNFLLPPLPPKFLLIAPNFIGNETHLASIILFVSYMLFPPLPPNFISNEAHLASIILFISYMLFPPLPPNFISNDTHQKNMGPYRSSPVAQTATATSDTYLCAKTRAQMKRVSDRNTKSDRYAPRIGDPLPDSFDWRKEGAVSPVKDQGSCEQGQS